MTNRRQLIFLTHAEVDIDPNSQPAEWGLSDTGHKRHAAFARHEALRDVSAIYTSSEHKAIEGGQPAAKALGLGAKAVSALGENDRSATGYLPSDEFERTADAFFARPDESIRGWETARAAQARVLAAVQTIIELDQTAGDLLIVAHGAVSALLRCKLMACEITRDEDQLAGGGCYFTADLDLRHAPSAWHRI